MDTTYEGNQFIIEESQSSLTSEEKSYRYAGFWMRFWAFLLDQIVVFSINGILVYPLFSYLGIMEERLWYFTIVSVLTGIMSYVYFVVSTKKFSRTLGKQVFGLKVISVNDENLSWNTVLFREVIGRFIHHAILITPILYLFVAFSNKKEGIHDRIADTYVVHEE